jgi:predicted anti-sigma-YlaC factor YlaD
MSHLTIETLNLYLDQALDAPTHAAVESHLATCEACRAELGALHELFGALAALPPEPLPADLAGPVLQRIASAPVPARPRAWPAGHPYAVALLATQVVLAGLLLAWFGPALTSTAVVELAALPRPELTALSTSLAWLEGWLATLGTILSRLIPAEGALRAGPLAGLSATQWAIGLVALGLVWLLGNRLILAGSSEPQNTQQEAA